MAEKVQLSEEEWREKLTPEQFYVAREKGTERAFTGKFHDYKGDGIYRCMACDAKLFDSNTKYNSGSGWPSFYEPIQEDAVRFEEDVSHGMRRVEVLCNSCGAHLGHVFPDGPQPTGQRYCINSVSLDFEDRES